MSILRFDRAKLSLDLRQVSEWKQTAFALAICERLYPNYVSFVRETGWGQPEIIAKSLSAAWKTLSDGRPCPCTNEYAEKCEEAAPDTEEFVSKYTSSALDAALSTANLMRLLTKFDPQKVIEIAESAYDTSELFAAHADTASVVTCEDRELIHAHPIVQAELRRQRDDLALLNGSEGDFGTFETLLRSKWTNQEAMR